MKRIIILLLTALVAFSYCKKAPETDAPGDETSSYDPSARPSEDPSDNPSNDPSEGPSDESEDPSVDAFVPPVIPEDQVSDYPDFDIPDEPVMKKVDMGMDVKWASCNLGASSPEDPGDFFAWGEVTVKDIFSLDTYKWAGAVNANNTYFNIFKYNVDFIVGNFDFNTVLDPEDDPATAALGEGWRLPTMEEMRELLLPSYTWTERDGGFEVKSSATGESIFFPGTGFNYNDENSEDGSLYYWTSTLAAEWGQDRAYALIQDGDLAIGPWTRFHGLYIRPVYGPAAKEPDPLVATYVAEGVSAGSATLTGYLYPRTSLSGVEAGMVISTQLYDYEPTLSSGKSIKATSIGSDSKFSVKATGLQDNRTYYYRSYVKVGSEVQYGVSQMFTTGEISVSTMYAEDVAEFSASIFGRLSAAGYQDLGVKAFTLYSTTAKDKDNLIDVGTRNNATIKKIDDDTAELVGSIQLDQSMYGATVYYLVGVEIGGKEYYGDIRSQKMKTADVAFQIMFDKIAETTAHVSGKIKVDTQADINKEFFLNYAKEDEDVVRVPVIPGTDGRFSISLHSLKWDSRYDCTISGTVGKMRYESARESFITKEFKFRSVDLGLSCKKNWANMNLGAKTQNERGERNRWGMPVDYLSDVEKDNINLFNSRYSNYLQRSGLEEWLENQSRDLPEQFDIVAVELGGNWRMPTYDDFVTLFTECDIYDYPYLGAVEVVSKANGNAIILINSIYEDALYWCATARMDNPRDPSNDGDAICWDIQGCDNISWWNAPGWSLKCFRPVKVL